MARVLLYYAHPGQRFSTVNAQLFTLAEQIAGISTVDLYRLYPRFNIDVDAEQDRLRGHDVIVFQHPLFWYATPALLKEWLDLVLEHGFAYGAGGTALQGKHLLQVISAAGPREAYAPAGYQHFDLRAFLTPMEQTARLCGMQYLAPYVLFGALSASEDARLDRHGAGYRALLEALRDDRLDLAQAAGGGVLTAEDLPLVTTV